MIVFVWPENCWKHTLRLHRQLRRTKSSTLTDFRNLHEWSSTRWHPTTNIAILGKISLIIWGIKHLEPRELFETNGHRSLVSQRFHKDPSQPQPNSSQSLTLMASFETALEGLFTAAAGFFIAAAADASPYISNNPISKVFTLLWSFMTDYYSDSSWEDSAWFKFILGEHVLSEPNSGHQTTWAVKQPSCEKARYILIYNLYDERWWGSEIPNDYVWLQMCHPLEPQMQNGFNLIKCKTLPPSTFQPSTFQPSNLHDLFRGEDHRSSITAKDESRLSLSWQLRGTGIRESHTQVHPLDVWYIYLHSPTKMAKWCQM